MPSIGPFSVKIESWIDNNRQLNSANQIKTTQIHVGDRNITFEHDLSKSEKYGPQTLHVKLSSGNNESNIFDINFIRRKKVIITVTDIFPSQNKLAIVGTTDESLDNCHIQLSFDNSTFTKKVPIFSNSFDFVSDIPQDARLKINPVRIQVINQKGRVIGETYKSINTENKVSILTNDCNLVYLLRRR
ncbi:hypothetical protein TVAG_368220 [Trichomonas vaginalis G3]|uniref:Uncharacterized protein n=1 Tax=Trichomonas vaginalis (strain ATCC PRA-98 / G3) TaxID=412133 RepID=A2FI34_TRIV3|nr:hypothetical protein TVAGG3_0365010 [Trichomonas vaginalis G3]EAX95421.1 hypothetical protein TVAG_368220 [Trichomonas vaginalis G3]KAI5532204.1 hypothetical protein TVAGG3_0365010 [Trichomonas vaginalis G3]|eukprot:XP_001308351.1 hypothetical protein [Trichomonas vaginalis G3]